ncbi:hypothetical protein EMCRGX_G008295 [Ephydatia muelleri]
MIPFLEPLDRAVHFLCIVMACCHAQNIDTKEPIIRTSPDLTSTDCFGYSAVLHQTPAATSFYKEDDTKDTKDTMAELKVQELLQMLIEDRKKREMEISEERERREKEFEAERRRRDEEREARERESQKRLEQMQAYMDKNQKRETSRKRV